MQDNYDRLGGGCMPLYSSKGLDNHLDLDFFRLGLLLGKPRGVDAIYYVSCLVNSRS
jgi:hypothetical protein